MKKYNVKLMILALFSVIFASSFMVAMENEPSKPIYEILARKKVDDLKAMHEANKDYLPSNYASFDSEKTYSELVEKYKEYEGILKVVKDLPNISLVSDLMTGINYTMTMEEMKQKIKATFHEMKQNGLIISKDQFESIKDKYYHHAKGFAGAPHGQISRIGGVEYLKKKIKEISALSKTYAVPDYIIVVDDPYNISVDIVFPIGGIVPIVATLNNGSIYFEKIIGDRVASWSNSMLVSDLRSIGYDDFTDPGNIIKQKGTDKYYIVDTEAKSFNLTRSMNELLKAVFEYASDRFLYLNPVTIRLKYTFDL